MQHVKHSTSRCLWNICVVHLLKVKLEPELVMFKYSATLSFANENSLLGTGTQQKQSSASPPTSSAYVLLEEVIWPHHVCMAVCVPCSGSCRSVQGVRTELRSMRMGWPLGSTWKPGQHGSKEGPSFCAIGWVSQGRVGERGFHGATWATVCHTHHLSVYLCIYSIYLKACVIFDNDQQVFTAGGTTKSEAIDQYLQYGSKW